MEERTVHEKRLCFVMELDVAEAHAPLRRRAQHACDDVCREPRARAFHRSRDVAQHDQRAALAAPLAPQHCRPARPIAARVERELHRIGVRGIGEPAQHCTTARRAAGICRALRLRAIDAARERAHEARDVDGFGAVLQWSYWGEQRRAFALERVRARVVGASAGVARQRAPGSCGARCRREFARCGALDELLRGLQQRLWDARRQHEARGAQIRARRLGAPCEHGVRPQHREARRGQHTIARLRKA